MLWKQFFDRGFVLPDVLVENQAMQPSSRCYRAYQNLHPSNRLIAADYEVRGWQVG